MSGYNCNNYYLQNDDCSNNRIQISSSYTTGKNTCSVTGAQGAQGATGNAGAQGATGAQGPIGPTGNVTFVGQGAPINQDPMTSSTLSVNAALGDNGDVYFDLLSGAVYILLNGFWLFQGFVGGRGAQGPQGPRGPQGPQGATGIGSQGPRGPQGAQGPAGSSTGRTGAQGAQGVTGAQGAQGEIGAQGETGAQGAQGVTGATGAQGEIGAQGATGAQGEIGAQGATGAQGEIGAQGATGEIGPQGAQGVAGTTGAQGAQGVTGAQGETGSQGTTGAQGATGPQGIAGPQGAQGATGPQGIAGAQGAQGATGATGAQGATGITPSDSGFFVYKIAETSFGAAGPTTPVANWSVVNPLTTVVNPYYISPDVSFDLATGTFIAPFTGKWSFKIDINYTASTASSNATIVVPPFFVLYTGVDPAIENLERFKRATLPVITTTRSTITGTTTLPANLRILVGVASVNITGDAFLQAGQILRLYYESPSPLTTLSIGGDTNQLTWAMHALTSPL